MIPLNDSQKADIRKLDVLNDSKFRYDTGRWGDLHANYKDLIKEFENKEISRFDVIETYKECFSEADTDYMSAFLLTMVWGFANTGYGTYRTNTYITSLENRGRIKLALDAIKVNGTAGLDKAFKELKKIKGLGISYLTKILYFATRARGLKDYTLIFDIRVARSLVMLTAPGAVYSIVNVNPSAKLEDYISFNHLLHTISIENGFEAEQLEMYLFNQEFV